MNKNGCNWNRYEASRGEFVGCDMNFKTKFPRVYALESDKKITVASKMNHNDVGLSLRRAPRDGVELEQFNNLNVFLAGTMYILNETIVELVRLWWSCWSGARLKRLQKCGPETKPEAELELAVKDDSCHSVVSLTMSDETTETLVGATAKVLFDKTCEIKNLINTTHILEIKLHIVESHITSNAVSLNAKLAELENTLPANMSDDVTKDQETPLKRLERGPTIVTPSKALNQRTKIISNQLN
ncbi:hypothetical protein Tco_1047514 [Tanacetum coccineum]